MDTPKILINIPQECFVSSDKKFAIFDLFGEQVSIPCDQMTDKRKTEDFCYEFRVPLNVVEDCGLHFFAEQRED